MNKELFHFANDIFPNIWHGLFKKDYIRLYGNGLRLREKY